MPGRYVLGGCLPAGAVAAVALEAGAVGIDVVYVDDRAEARACRLGVQLRLCSVLR